MPIHIFTTKGRTENLLDSLDLNVLEQRLSSRLTDVEKLSSEGEDSKVVTTDDRDTTDCESLGGVSFGEDEGAFVSLLGSCVVGVFELDESRDSEVLVVSKAYMEARGGLTLHACVHRSS